MVYLLVVLHCGDLRETATTELAAIRFLSGVTSHVPLQTGCFKEAFSTIAAEVGSFVVMLLSVENGGIPIGELSSTILTLVDLAHTVAARNCKKKSDIKKIFIPGQVLFQVACSGEALLTELALPGLVFVVHSVDVDSHVVAKHEHLVTLRTGNAWCSWDLLLWRGTFCYCCRCWFPHGVGLLVGVRYLWGFKEWVFGRFFQ